MALLQHRVVWRLAVGLAGFLFVCVELGSAQTQTVSVSGSVVAEGGTPQKARVVVQPLPTSWARAARLAQSAGVSMEIDGPVAHSIEARENGDYRIEVPVGLWTIRIEADGHQPRCLEAVPLVSDCDLGAVPLKERPGHPFRVVDPEGEALQGAFLLPPEPTAEAFEWSYCSDPLRPDAEGFIDAPDSASGSWTVAAPGFVPQALKEIPDDGVVELKPRAEESTEILVRASSGSGPLPRVLALDAGGRWPVAVSDPEGRLRVPVDVPSLDLLAPDGRLLEEVSVARERVIFPPPVPVGGEVVDLQAEDRRLLPIPGAVVWSVTAPGIWMRSDAHGRFAFDHLPQDPSERTPAVRIAAAAPGYETEESPVASGLPGSAARKALLDFKLLLSSASARGHWEGRVVDGSGEAIEGARVVLTPDEAIDERAQLFAGADPRDNRRSAVTDALGRFVIDGEAQGYWDLVVLHDTKRPLVVPGLPSLEPGETRDVGTLALADPLVLHGVVLDSDRRPVAGARVERLFRFQEGDYGEVFPDATGEPSTTGSDGRFHVPLRIPEGATASVDLRISREGFQPALLKNVRPPLEAEPEILLERFGSLRGRVASPENEPVAGAMVVLAPNDATGALHGSSPPGPSVVTDDQGRFEIDRVPPGSTWLRVDAEGFATRKVRLATSPGESQSLTISLVPSAEMAGVVLQPNGEPVGGAMVRVDSAFDQTGADGAFQLEGLESGYYVVRTSHEELGLALEEVFLDPEEPLLDVTLVLRPEWILHGQVVDENGRALAGATVDAHDALLGGFVSSERSGDAGRFRFVDLDPGRYELSVLADGRETIEPESVTLGPSAPNRSVTLVVHPRGRIEGSIAGNAPRPGQLRVEWSCAGRRPRLGDVFPDSTFQIDGVSLGACWVVAREVASDRLAAERVRLSPSDPTESVTLVFGEGERLQGRVSRGSSPLDGARVSLWSEGALVAETPTDSWGHFELVGIPPGEYVLSVHLAGNPVFFPAGVTVPGPPVDWSLETGRIELSVEDSTHRPVRSARATARLAEDGSRPPIQAVCYQGRCLWSELGPGRYTLSVDGLGHEPTQIEVEVEGARTARASARLR